MMGSEQVMMILPCCKLRIELQGFPPADCYLLQTIPPCPKIRPDRGIGPVQGHRGMAEIHSNRHTLRTFRHQVIRTCAQSLSAMDWAAGSTRHPALRLCHQAPQQQEHGCIPSRILVEGHVYHPQVLRHFPQTPSSLRPVREYATIRLTSVFVPGPAEPRIPHCQHNQHSRYLRSRIETVLEPQRTHAGGQYTCHRALSRDP